MMMKLAAYLGTLMALGFGSPSQAQTVSTYRSDGMVSPQVKAQLRKERPRQVRVNRSSDVLPQPGSRVDPVEPVGGGMRLAPASQGGDGLSAALIYEVNPGALPKQSARKPRSAPPPRN